MMAQESHIAPLCHGIVQWILQAIGFQPNEAWFWTFPFSIQPLRVPKPHMEEEINL